MFDYDARGELASRDIVSQSIYKELKESQRKCVYLDCTHLDIGEFKHHFPMIYHHCKDLGIDIAQDWIPVIPAQHYLCGGIVVDKNGKTSVEHLFACGECSRTGLHGANRLASNSLLEALVFSERIFKYISGTSLISLTVNQEFSEWNPIQKGEIPSSYLKETEEELQLLMRENAGIVRTDADLLSVKIRLTDLQKEVEGKYSQYKIATSLCELRNMIQVALLIVEQSLQRSKNCGGFLKMNPIVVD
jgi:L-aspartate oxidase